MRIFVTQNRMSSALFGYTASFTKLLAEKYSTRTVLRYDGQRYPSSGAELMPLMTYGEPKVVQDGNTQKLTVVRCGIGGNTVKRLLARADDFLGKRIYGRNADLFIVSVGINDSLKNDPKKYVTPSQYSDDLNKLIGLMKTSAPDSDIILMTPSYNDIGDSEVSSVDEYAQEMLKVASTRQLPIIDLHKMWMEHLCVGCENYGQGDWLSGVKGDMCHPSDIGHAAIADKIFKDIFEI